MFKLQSCGWLVAFVIMTLVGDSGNGFCCCVANFNVIMSFCRLTDSRDSVRSIRGVFMQCAI